MVQEIRDFMNVEIETRSKQKRKMFFLQYIFYIHDYFSIFLMFDEELSRPVRFSLYYLKILLLIALSGLFSQ